jgi:hypothetical protein
VVTEPFHTTPRSSHRSEQPLYRRLQITVGLRERVHRLFTVEAHLHQLRDLRVVHPPTPGVLVQSRTLMRCAILGAHNAQPQPGL